MKIFQKDGKYYAAISNNFVINPIFLNMTDKFTPEERREIAVNKLKGLGEVIIEDVSKDKVPSLKVPSRGTSNIHYDKEKRYYVLHNQTSLALSNHHPCTSGPQDDNCQYR